MFSETTSQHQLRCLIQFREGEETVPTFSLRLLASTTDFAEKKWASCGWPYLPKGATPAGPEVEHAIVSTNEKKSVASLPGVYISVQKRYLFPLLLKMIFAPSHDMLFFDSHHGLFAIIIPYFAFILPFYFPYSHFPSLFFPFSFAFLPFSFTFSPFFSSLFLWVSRLP
jgi:hypothetical protein